MKPTHKIILEPQFFHCSPGKTIKIWVMIFFSKESTFRINELLTNFRPGRNLQLQAHRKAGAVPFPYFPE